jgi:phospholipid-binding lipoprotein MlaA
MMSQFKLLCTKCLPIIIVVLLLSGCASSLVTREAQAQVPILVVDERDPWEQTNRKIFAFNDGLDRMFVTPVTNFYTRITPHIIQYGVENFFANIADVGNIMNHGLQLKLPIAGKHAVRLVLNTSVGLGGILDVASYVGIYAQPEDFGQTLGYWGVMPRYYVMLPIIGPTTLRDGFGMLIDLPYDPMQHYNPVDHRLALQVLRTVDRRRSLQDVDDLIVGDAYVYLRSVYLQRRAFLISDGAPTETTIDEFDEFD